MATRRTKKAVLVRTDLELKPVMFVCGPERALVKGAIQHIRQQVLAGSAMADFNHDRISGKTAAVERIIACAKTLPVMSAQRLVEVDEGEALGADGLQVIAAYAADPVPESVLLIVAKDIDKRTKAAKALAKLACLFRYEHLDEYGLTQYTQKRAREMKLQLDDEAASVLVTAVGTELLLVERALEKLQLVKEQGAITVADVEEHISQTRIESVFNLTEAIARGRVGEALQVLGQMLDAREAPLRILATLVWQQRQLVRARALLDQGMPGRQVAREVRVFRFGERFISQVQSMTAQRVRKGLAVLADTDRKLKSSRVAARILMEGTVIALASLR